MTPEQYLAKAERALASARLLQRNGDVKGAVVHRLLKQGLMQEHLIGRTRLV